MKDKPYEGWRTITPEMRRRVERVIRDWRQHARPFEDTAYWSKRFLPYDDVFQRTVGTTSRRLYRSERTDIDNQYENRFTSWAHREGDVHGFGWGSRRTVTAMFRPEDILVDFVNLGNDKEAMGEVIVRPGRYAIEDYRSWYRQLLDRERAMRENPPSSPIKAAIEDADGRLQRFGIVDRITIKFRTTLEPGWLGQYRSLSQFKSGPIFWVNSNITEDNYPDHDVHRIIVDTILHEYGHVIWEFGRLRDQKLYEMCEAVSDGDEEEFAETFAVVVSNNAVSPTYRKIVKQYLKSLGKLE